MTVRREHPAERDDDALLAECDTQRTRRSGPGGQNRNKVETAIVLTHRPTGLVAEASERRSQAENLRIALHRLRRLLALEVRLPVVADEVPSTLWQSRLRGGRLVVSESHDDFSRLLAEALDVLEGSAMNVARAAALLGCTGSQLTKLLRQEPRAFQQFNARRRALGLHSLH